MPLVDALSLDASNTLLLRILFSSSQSALTISNSPSNSTKLEGRGAALQVPSGALDGSLFA